MSAEQAGAMLRGESTSSVLNHMTKSMKIRLALVLVMGSYIAWQQYQRQSRTIITTQSVLESTQGGSQTAELMPAGGLPESDSKLGQSGSEGSPVTGSDTDGRSESSLLQTENQSSDDPAGGVADTDNFSTPQTVMAPQGDQSPDTPVLSPVTFAAINNIQQLMMEEKWDTALEQLNAMYEQRDQLNGFERSTMLNFYTNVLLHHRMYDEATLVFEEIVAIPETNERVRDRALQSLAQLHARSQL